jgi:hypothetical protein
MAAEAVQVAEKAAVEATIPAEARADPPGEIAAVPGVRGLEAETTAATRAQVAIRVQELATRPMVRGEAAAR